MFNARKPFSTAEKIQKIKIPFLFLIDFGILFVLPSRIQFVPISNVFNDIFAS